MRKQLDRYKWAMMAILTVALLTGCASASPFVINETQMVIDAPSTTAHQFDYIKVYPENDGLVLYGKVKHRHGWCTEPHVDLALTGPDGRVARRLSLPVSNQRGGKMYGWYGASFRGKLPDLPAQGYKIRLVFHETDCAAEMNYDCKENAAAK